MEDAQARKARLKALREAAAASDAGQEEAAGPGPQSGADVPQLKFRNYNVKDQKIEHSKLEPAQPPKFEAPKPDTVMSDADGPKRVEDLLANVAPKKPNWDLRRDVEKKLQKLERRTQRAIIKLVQQQQAQEQETA